MIVFSILLAFGIDAWWGNRQEEARQVSALANLQSALARSLDEIAVEQQDLRNSRRLLASFTSRDPESLQDVPRDSVPAYWGAVQRPIVDDLGTEVVSEMLAGGDLVGLDDAVWHSSVADWRDARQDLRQRHESLYEIERLFWLAMGRAELKVDSLGTDLSGARRDAEVMALMSAKLEHWRVLEYLIGRVHADSEALMAEAQTRVRR